MNDDPKRRDGIFQQSFGANSPNIVGNNNQVVLNAPRVLSQATGERIARAVAQIPRGELVVTAYLSSDDAQDYAAYVASAIADGGWGIQGNCINRAVGTIADRIRGLALLVRNADDAPALASRLAGALASAGASCPVITDESLSADTIVLWVGRR